MTRPEAMAFCQKQRRGHKTYRQIQSDLEAEGFPAALSTVKEWASPKLARRENQRRADQAHNRRSYERIVRLRQLGLSAPDIAKVMGLYHGTRLTGSQVQYALEKGGPRWAGRA